MQLTEYWVQYITRKSFRACDFMHKSPKISSQHLILFCINFCILPDFKEKQLAYLFSHTPKTNMHKYVKLQIGVKWINIHLEKRKGFKGGKDRKQSWQIRFFHQQFYLSKNTWWEKSMSKSRMSISALWLMKIRKKDKMYMIKSNNLDLYGWKVPKLL